jgi:NTE family protein
MKPDWALLNYLYSAGRDEAEKWVSRHRASVGHRSSVDLRARFLAAERPGDTAAATGSRVRPPRKQPAAADIPD